MTKLLMCKPDYFGIEYEINPWMSLKRQADREVAARQWYDLYRALRGKAGAQVELVESRPGLPDLVFTANAGLVDGDLVVRSNFRHSQRAREESVYEAWFAADGFKIWTLPPALRFEGEGDAFIVGDRIFMGYGFRTDRAAHEAVAEIVGKQAVSLELVDPYFYHLDTCFFPLDEGRAFYYPDAFSPESQRLLREHVPELLAVGPEEARRFVCNSIVIDRCVVLNGECVETKRRLEEWGYQVMMVNTSEFLKAGGGAKCMVLFLSKGAATAAGVRGASRQQFGRS